jgi:ubiquinone/menaquinone biosynthesis C-methylase UbiE
MKVRNTGWRDYWKSDRPSSCIAAQEMARTQIESWWRSYFSELPADSRVLDIATGNGVVLAHAVQAAEDRNIRFDLTGVDLADIDPVRYLSTPPAGLREARFMGGVAAESLPFAAESFDVVVSQYGLEYADLEKALSEVERVLRGGGRVRWLAHSEESEVVRQNSDQHRQVDFLLRSKGPVQSMEQLIEGISRRRSTQAAMTSLATAMRSAERYCRDHPPADMVQEVCRGFADVASRWKAFYATDLAAMIKDTRRKLVAHRHRIEDLRAAVMTPSRQNRVQNIFRGPEWGSVYVSELRVGQSQGSIGIVIEANHT